MPVTKSANKAMRRDRRRQLVNRNIRNSIKHALDEVRSNKTPKTLSAAYSVLDKATKKGVVHANKAARLKSRITMIKTNKKTSTKKIKIPLQKTHVQIISSLSNFIPIPYVLDYEYT